MNTKRMLWISVGKTVLGTALFALGLDLFLLPNDLNTGGVSGIAMVVRQMLSWLGNQTVLDLISIGVITVAINLPLFALAGMKIGKRFFWGSLLGMTLLSVFIDVFSGIPISDTEPLVGALYGGVVCGLGGGLVFSSGFSTGGSDIVIRLLKKKWPFVPLGIFTTAFDLMIAVITGVVFGDVNNALYCGVSIFVTGRVVDAVVYKFDYSKVAIIVTRFHEQIAYRLGAELHRGSTFLHGEGSYSHKDTMVVLTAVKKHQLAEMKEIVTQEDPDAFIIVQEAHQVLGDGFARYSKDAL